MPKLPAVRPPRALDLRLVIGIALVLASAAGVYAVITAADRSATVYAAPHHPRTG